MNCFVRNNDDDTACNGTQDPAIVENIFCLGSVFRKRNTLSYFSYLKVLRASAEFHRRGPRCRADGWKNRTLHILQGHNSRPLFRDTGPIFLPRRLSLSLEIPSLQVKKKNLP